MNDQQLHAWFDSQRSLLKTAYLAGVDPWQQSGVGLHTPHTAQDWEVLRWTSERGLSITPYGLDFSPQLLSLAGQRLPQYADHFFLGNAWDWSPPQPFDYVNASLDYVPSELRQAFAERLLERYVEDGGRLLLCEYLGRSTGMPNPRIDEELTQWGYPLEMVQSSWLEHDPVRQTQVTVIRKV
jgi:hypothetical protein